jgi:HK97 family phage major capsid protein
MLEFLKRQLEKLLDERSALTTEAEAIIAAAEAEKREKLNDAEQASFDEKRSAIKAKDAEIEEQRARVADAVEAEARTSAANAIRGESAPAERRTERPSGAAEVREPSIYQRGDFRQSWVRDMFAVATNGGDANEARDRLSRNTREVNEARALTTVAGAGGEFAPPAWLINQFVTLARAARPTADRVMNQALPMGISSVNVPKLLTGTATAQQATQNTAVQNTDATTSSVTAAIVTIAGGQTVSQQLLDQSGVNIDEILLQDLAMDYAAKVDLFVLNNNATNAKGLLQQSGVTALTYTSGTPTTKLLYGQIAAAIAGVQGSRYLAPDTIVMHPAPVGGVRRRRRLGRPSPHVPDRCRLGAAGHREPGLRRAGRRRQPRRAGRHHGPADPDEPRGGHEPGPRHRHACRRRDPVGGGAEVGGVPRDEGRHAQRVPARLQLRGVHRGPLPGRHRCHQRYRPGAAHLRRLLADKRRDRPDHGRQHARPRPRWTRRSSRATTSWPKPGDEGFVHPDGTPQSVAQLEENKQAQADRDHAGSVASTAPRSPPPARRPASVTAEKVANAAEVGGEDAAPQTWVEANLPTAEDVAAESKPAAAPSRSRASEK